MSKSLIVAAALCFRLCFAPADANLGRNGNYHQSACNNPPKVLHPATGESPGADALQWIARAKQALPYVERGFIDQAATAVVKAQNSAGDFSGAIATTQRISSSADRAWLLVDIAKSQVKAGDLTGASTTIQKAETAAIAGSDNTVKAKLLAEIEKVRIAVGDSAKARLTIDIWKEAALSIPDSAVKAQQLAAIAESQVAAGVPADADSTLNTAIATALSIPQNSREKELALIEIALVKADRGDVSGAIAFAQSISYPGARASVLSEISKIQFKAGDASGATVTLASAATAARDASDIFRMVDVSIKIAEIQFENSDTSGANTTITSAVAAVTASQAAASDWQNLRSFYYLAHKQVIFGNLQEARTILSTAKAEAEKMKPDAEKKSAWANSELSDYVFGLCFVADIQIDLNDRQGTATTLDEAGTALQTTSDNSVKLHLLVLVAGRRFKAGDMPGTRATIALALAAALAITDGPTRSSCIGQIAGFQRSIGDESGAIATAQAISSPNSKDAESYSAVKLQVKDNIATAMATAERISSTEWRSDAFAFIAESAAQKEDFRNALQAIQKIATATQKINVYCSIACTILEAKNTEEH